MLTLYLIFSSALNRTQEAVSTSKVQRFGNYFLFRQYYGSFNAIHRWQIVYPFSSNQWKAPCLKEENVAEVQSTLNPQTPTLPPALLSVNHRTKTTNGEKTFSISKIGQKRRNNSEWQMGCSTPCQKWKVNELQKGKLLNYRLGGQQFQFKFSIYAFFTANHAWRSDGWKMWGN